LDLATIPDLFPRLKGDFNADDIVDAADYVVWRKTLGGDVLLIADASRNAIVDEPDYDFWRANFGAAALPSGPAAPVPEPMCPLMLAAMIVLMSNLSHRAPQGRGIRRRPSAGRYSQPRIN
jgi:hypothetical protein